MATADPLVRKVIAEHGLYSVDLQDPAYEDADKRESLRTNDITKATVVSSEMDSPRGMHRVLLDLDMPCALVPSSTPGHFHLYIDKMLPWEAYEGLLDALGAAGILEPGYVQVSKSRKATFLRLPWITKEARDGKA